MSTGRPSLPGRRAAVLILGAAMAASFALLLSYGANITFFLDDWELVLHRRGLSVDVILAPNNEHPAMAPVVIYKLVLATFGMDSAQPFHVVALLGFLLADALLFIWVRRRVGAWLALAGAIPILFLGSAYEDLLWQFQVGYFGSMACGLGALLALDRDDDVGDRIACALLVGGLLFSSVGLPFIAAALVVVGWDRRRWRRAYVILIPVALYALWWLGWGREAEHHLTWKGAATSASYVLDGLASSLSSLLGLATSRSDMPLTSANWGTPLLAALAVVGIWQVARRGGPSRTLVALLAVAVAFWFLAALNVNQFRGPYVPRYQYVGAVFIVLIAAELLRGVRVTRAVAAAAAVFVVVSIAANLVDLDRGRDGLEKVSGLTRGGLAGLELARDTVDPDLVLNDENSDNFYANLVDARSYLSAVDAYGSPAYSEGELAGAPEPGRVAADKVLAAALPITADSSRARLGRGRCVEVAPAEPSAPATVRLAQGGAVIESTGEAEVELGLRRYAEGSFPVDLPPVEGGRTEAVQIPGDRSTRPWQLSVASREGARVCAPE